MTGSAARPFPVILVVGLGTLLSALAGSSVNLALPRIGHELALTVGDTRWVLQSFLLAVTVLLIPAGRLGDLWSHRALYLWGFGLFGATSLLAGLADHLGTLLLARVLQGVGGAMVMAAGPALLTTSVPGAWRGRALGMVATATYAGLTLGPPLGGLVISHLGWRWVFLLNVPVALVMALVGPWLLPRPPRREAPALPFDRLGAAALILGLPPLLIAISEGQRWGWGAWPTLLLAALGAAGLAAFLWIQRRVPAPLLDLGLFRRRDFTVSVLSALVNYVCLFVPILLLPFFFVEGQRRGEDRAGLLLMAQPVVMALVATPAGWLSDRIGSRALTVAGMVVMAAALAGLTRLEAGAGTSTAVAWLGLLGLGTGIFISPNSSALMGAAPRGQQGSAAGVLAVSRNLGMMLGVVLGAGAFASFGGRTGDAWGAGDTVALHRALALAAGGAALGAVVALLGRAPAAREPAQEP